jgi:hypothetical protein
MNKCFSQPFILSKYYQEELISEDLQDSPIILFWPQVIILYKLLVVK